jgi:hypothetical protein
MSLVYKNLDETWINEFEKSDKLYQEFYKDDIYYLTVYFIYVNKNENIEKIKEEIFFMNKPNIISRDEIIGILKRNTFINNIKYSLLSILKYNILLEPLDICNLLSLNNFDTDSEYLSIIKNIDDIYFEKTINMFQDLNNLFIIYYEKDYDNLSKKLNSTKKVYFKNKSNTNKNKTIRR